MRVGSDNKVQASLINVGDDVVGGTDSADPSGGASSEPKPASLSPVSDLAACDLSAQRPWVVKDGSIVCQQEALPVLQTASIEGLSDAQRRNLGDSLIVAGKVGEVTVAYSDPSYAPGIVVAIGGDNKLIWAKVYSRPITVTVADDAIWVLADATISKLVPAKNGEGAEQDGKVVVEGEIKVMTGEAILKKYVRNSDSSIRYFREHGPGPLMKEYAILIADKDVTYRSVNDGGSYKFAQGSIFSLNIYIMSRVQLTGGDNTMARGLPLPLETGLDFHIKLLRFHPPYHPVRW